MYLHKVHTHTHRYTVSAVLRISSFAFLMMLSMTMFGQNYGTISPTGGSGNISLGQWHGNGTIDPNTRFYINTANQNGAEIRVTGSYRKGLSIYTSSYASTALEVQSTHPMSFAARFTGKVEFIGGVAFGGSPIYLASHEKLAVRNGMITTDGIGNGISLTGSYYGTTPNDFGTQRYGLFMGDPTQLSLSMSQNSTQKPVVLSSFYGLGFDVYGGKMALCQNGALVLGSNNTLITDIADLDIWALDYQLFVEKGIRTEKVRVDLKTNWADYVFETDYDLLSLVEVEQFITTNKHLPNVPSAAEVKANGIDIAQMDEILLRKVEELTLYTIEQEKLIEATNKELATMKKQLAEFEEILNALKK